MKLPKDTEDWHLKLISAFNDRTKYAFDTSKKDQNNWQTALLALQASHDPIFIQKGGENKGNVKGIPKDIKGVYRDKLIAIVNGNEAWDDPKYRNIQEINWATSNFYENRKYRDSCYGVLAALYSQTTGDPTILYKAQLINVMHKYHDGEVAGDRYQFGAWKAMDTLVGKHMVIKEKAGTTYRYHLTNIGFQLCYLIFNEKFHPSKGAYQLVEPGNCTVSAKGVVTRRNGQPAAHVAPVANIPPDFGAHNAQFDDDDDADHHTFSLPGAKKQRTEQSTLFGQLTSSEMRQQRIDRLDNVTKVSDSDRLIMAAAQKISSESDLTFDEAEAIVRAEEAIAAEKRRAEHRAQQEAQLQQERVREEAKRLSALSAVAPNRSGSGSCNSESQDLDEALYLSELSAREEEKRRRELSLPRNSHFTSFHGSSSSSSRAMVCAEAKFTAEQQQSSKYEEQPQSHSQEEACLEVALAMSLENNSHLPQTDMTISSSTNPVEDKMSVSSPLRLSRPTHPTLSIQTAEQEKEEEEEEVPVSKRSAAWTPTKSARNYVMDLTEEKPARPLLKATSSSSGGSGNSNGGGAALPPHRSGGLSLNERLNQFIASLPSSPQPVVRPTQQQSLFTSPRAFTVSSSNSAHHNVVTTSSCSKPLFTASYSAASNVVDLCLSDDDDEAETQPLPDHSDSEGDYCVVTDRDAGASAVPITTAATTVAGMRWREDEGDHMDWEEPDGSSLLSITATDDANNKRLDTRNKSLKKVSDACVRSAVNLTSADVQPTLLMDHRERKNDAFYRKFYHDLCNKLDQSLGPDACSCSEERLSLADFHLGFKLRGEAVDQLFLGEVALERKALGDIVSRSSGESRSKRCGTAAHYVQERRLRQSGLRHCYMLLEGDLRTIKNLKPLVWSELDLQNPDVLHTADDLRRYMVAVIARNYNRSHRVGVFATHSNAHSVLLLTALAAVTNYQHSIKQTKVVQCFEKTVFDKFVQSWGAEKRGREAQLRDDLAAGGVHKEMIERIMRRFGDWTALLDVYRSYIQHRQSGSSSSRSIANNAARIGFTVEAGVEASCKALLSDLDVCGSNTERTALVLVDPDDDELHTLLVEEAEKVWLLVRARLADEGVVPVVPTVAPNFKSTVSSLAVSGFNSRRVVGCCSADMATVMGAAVSAFPKVIVESDSSSASSSNRSSSSSSTGNDKSYPLLSFHVESADLHRRSRRLHVVIVPGVDIVEALVAAVSERKRSKHPGQPLDITDECAIVHKTLDILRASFPKLVRENYDKVGSNDQLVVLFEGLALYQNSSGAMSRFKKACSTGLSQPLATDTQITLGPNRPGMLLNDATEIDSRSEWMVHILTAAASLSTEWQVFLTRSSEDSRDFIVMLLEEIQRQALLTM